MNKKGLDQRCTAMKILGNRNWEDYIWPHQIDKIPRLDPEVLSFLQKLNLSRLAGIFENEEVLSMKVVIALNEDDLKGIGIKLGDRKIILMETSKLIQAQSSSTAKDNNDDNDKPPFVQDQQNPRKKMNTIEPPSSASSLPPPVQSEHQPTVKPKEIESPFLLISSSGPSADHWSEMFGLFRKTEQMREGRNVYIQMHDKKYGASSLKLFTAQGVWTIAGRTVYMRATTPSESPTSVTWQYMVFDKDTGQDDPALTVTNLSEKPSDCEVTISLSKNAKRDIRQPGVAGLYKTDGSYRQGRPVLRHEGGRLTLYVYGACWCVCTAGGDIYLYSGSAPSLCPADPRAARNESGGQTLWRYRNKLGGFPESSGITIRCAKHSH